MRAKSYPHISRASKILGGIPVITGTRTSVRAVAGYYQMGMNPDEILQTLPHLTLGQIHAALTYSFDHQKAIDREIARANDMSHWKQQAEQFTKQLA